MIKELQIFLAIVLFGMACRPDFCEEYEGFSAEQRILTIGDSILAWGTPNCTSVSHQLGLQREESISVGAINGTEVTAGRSMIPDQYFEDDWEWVIMDGGANDLNKQCSCLEGCDAVLNSLVTEDGTQGGMTDLVERISVADTQVLLIGYYVMPEDAWYGFGECVDELTELNLRYAKIAEGLSNVHFAPLDDVMNWEKEPSLLDGDRVHPSVEGAEVIGEYLVELIEKYETE